MGLDGKKILIEALNGFFLEYKVNPASSIQHPHFDLGLLSLISWLRGLRFFTHGYWDRGKYIKDLRHFTQADLQNQTIVPWSLANTTLL